MSLEAQANAVKEALHQEIEKSKTTIFEGLVSNFTPNTIPESIFVNYFLPCFLNHSTNPNWVMEWISIAGTPMAEVYVHSDTTKEFLYAVPSILNTNNLFLNKQDGDLGDIFSRYSQIKANVPTQGINFLFNALNAKNTEITNSVNHEDVNQKWMYILQRYNVIKPQPNLDQGNEKQQQDYFE